jgi:hypothetical protein
VDARVIKMQATQDPFPDQEKHHPDCGTVTDTQLKQAIISRWPSDSDVTTIPFSFSSMPLWGDIFALASNRNYLPERLEGEQGELVKETIRFALSKWTHSSNGTLKFVEQNHSTLFSSGLFFYLGGSEEHFSTTPPISGAFTQLRIDNNGYIHRAFIFLPNDKYLWENKVGDPWPMNTWTHETGHGLGFAHLHEYDDIKDILRQTLDGEYCSVMPYNQEIYTNTSRCHEFCTPPYAVYPGQLDARLIQLSYVTGAMTYASRDQIFNYLINGVEVGISSLLAVATHATVEAFFSNLAFYKNKPLLPKKAAMLLADAVLFTGVILLEVSPWARGFYAITAATKYLPEIILNDIPPQMKSVFTSNYSLYVFNTVGAFEQGQLPLPLAFSLGMSTFMTFTSQYVSVLGKISAWAINQIPQAITSRWCHTVEIEPPQDNYQLLEDGLPPPRTENIVSSNSNSFFHARQRSSLCTRLSLWLGCSAEEEHDDQNENDIPSPSLGLGYAPAKT